MTAGNKNIRIRTKVGQDKFVKFNLEQDFDFLEILSLKISQKEVYQQFCSEYGAIAGRVIINNGFGVPNAKVSIFIPLKEEDEENTELVGLYPYKQVTDLNSDNIRYNLLPRKQQSECHVPVGTFPSKREILDNPIISEINRKYYKFTTTTNRAGDFIIFGIPVGAYILHVDVDLSDIGIISQHPYDMIRQGFNENFFDSTVRFKKSNNLDSLPQIITQNIGANIIPFWGAEDVCEIGITRTDIILPYRIEPAAIFMGSIFGDNDKNSVNKNCRPRKKLGSLCDMVTGEGTIEMIRKTIDDRTERFDVKGGRVIDENGVWCYQIPMNLDFRITDEFGNLIPTEDTTQGVPTKAKVRFRIGMDQTGDEGRLRSRAKYLVPHNPRSQNEIDFTFDDTTQSNSFKELEFNKVYTVRNFITRYQSSCGLNCADNRNFIGIKDVDDCGDKTPFPYNNMDTDINPTFTIACLLTKILVALINIINIAVIPTINFVIKIVNTIIDVINKIIESINKVISVIDKLINFIKNLGGGSTANEPPLVIGTINNINPKSCITLTCQDEEYAPGCTNGGLDDGDAFKETPQPFKTSGLSECITNALAEALNVFKFDFYNDWINGSLYMFLFKYKKKSNGKEKFCDFDCENSENNCKNSKLVISCINGVKSVSPFGGISVDEGLIQTLDDNLYYVPTTKSAALPYFATDITVLGSSVDCHPSGIKKIIESILPTTYKRPPLVTENEDPTAITTGVDPLFGNITCVGITTTATNCNNLKRFCELGVGEDETPFANIIIDDNDIENPELRGNLICMNTPLLCATSPAISGGGFNNSDYLSFRETINLFPRGNSLYFYFGISPGKTALDKALAVYFAPCETLKEDPFIVNFIKQDVTTNGGNDGSIDLTIIGGVSPYTFKWTGPSGFIPPPLNAEDISNLRAGAYNVIVIDSLGQKVSITITVNQPTTITFTLFQIPATQNGNCNGSINVSFVSGGLPPYTYTLFDVNGNQIAGPNSQSNNVFGNLCVGTYSVSVEDSLGQIQTKTIDVTEPQPLVVTITKNDVLCKGGKTGSFFADISGGVPPYTINAVGPSVTQPTKQNQTNLKAGTYGVTVTDANGQTFTSSAIIINEPNAIVVTTSHTDVSCFNGNDGSVSASASGGVPPYSFLWSNGVSGANNPNIGVGTYSVTVSDSNGCTKSASESVGQPSELKLVLLEGGGSCPPGDTLVTAEASGGDPFPINKYTYTWFNPSNSIIQQETNENSERCIDNGTGTYRVVVTDSNGCEVEKFYTS